MVTLLNDRSCVSRLPGPCVETEEGWTQSLDRVGQRQQCDCSGKKDGERKQREQQIRLIYLKVHLRLVFVLTSEQMTLHQQG